MFRRGQLPEVGSYYEAKELYESIKPIRGRATDVRPMGVRRKSEAHIKKVEVEGGQPNYVAMLYNTPVLTYYPNGDIRVRTDGYNTQTSSQFLNLVLPGDIYTSYGRNTMVIWQRKKTDASKMDEYKIPNNTDGLMIRLPWDNGTQRLFVLNAQKEYVYVVNRKAMNEKREKYKTFYGYLKSICKMMDRVEYDFANDQDLATYVGLFGAEKNSEGRSRPVNPHWMRDSRDLNREELAKEVLPLLEGEPDGGVMYEVAQRIIGYSSGVIMEWDHTRYMPRKVAFLPNEAKATNFFNDLLKWQYSEEVFVQKEVEQGVVKFNSNAKYI